MAIVNIDYSCGCGFHAKTVEEAIGHADQAQHKVNVAGTIRSAEQKVRKPRSSSYVHVDSRRPVRKPTAKVTQQHTQPMQPESTTDFSSLRSRLQKK